MSKIHSKEQSHFSSKDIFFQLFCPMTSLFGVRPLYIMGNLYKANECQSIPFLNMFIIHYTTSSSCQAFCVLFALGSTIFDIYHHSAFVVVGFCCCWFCCCWQF